MTHPILKGIHQLRSNMKLKRTLTSTVRIKIKTKEYKVFHHSMNNASKGPKTTNRNKTISSNAIVSNFTLIKEDLLVGAEAVGDET
jgi:hypothetical protein